MAVQILSDLHLEAPKAYDVFNITPNAPYLALLGDVGNVATHKDEFLAFLTRQLKRFRAVFFVPGNHESYGSNWKDTLDILRVFEMESYGSDSLGEFVLLDRKAFRIPNSNTVILGCSLFSRVPAKDEMAVSFGLNDFFQIQGWDVNLHNKAHERDLAWLNEQVAELEESDVEIIILTHWSPTLHPKSFDQKHAGSKLASGFSTDLSGELCFKSHRVMAWVFGHTHYNCDFMVERENEAKAFRLLTNQRGYYFAQAEGFDEQKIVEL